MTHQEIKLFVTELTNPETREEAILNNKVLFALYNIVYGVLLGDDYEIPSVDRITQELFDRINKY